MPIVKVELLAGRTREQKAAAAREITAAIERSLGVKPENTMVLFQDIEKSDWATAGKLADET
ncbi:MAG TPA: tautomerase family protein [Stellaceae bacterium]|nr:tautomerase family protein [Stellaceae bacterium]